MKGNRPERGFESKKQNFSVYNYVDILWTNCVKLEIFAFRKKLFPILPQVFLDLLTFNRVA